MLVCWSKKKEVRISLALDSFLFGMRDHSMTDRYTLAQLLSNCRSHQKLQRWPTQLSSFCEPIARFFKIATLNLEHVGTAGSFSLHCSWGSETQQKLSKLASLGGKKNIGLLKSKDKGTNMPGRASGNSASHYRALTTRMQTKQFNPCPLPFRTIL